MDVLSFLFVPTILFLTVLGPIWLVMHYTTKRREAKTLLAEEEEALNGLLDAADRMEERIASLEKILNADTPDWKKDSAQ
jgi:phage shock protein B